MNKAQLVEAIATKSELTKSEAEKALNAFIEVTIKTVKSDEKVAVSGLGTFEKVRRAARNGINPITKETIRIQAKNAPKFKAAKAFKEGVA